MDTHLLSCQFVAQRHDAREHAEEDVGAEGALVRLVHNDHRVLLQQKVVLDLAQQNTVRHVLDGGVLAGAILKTDGVPHLRTHSPSIAVSTSPVNYRGPMQYCMWDHFKQLEQM